MESLPPPLAAMGAREQFVTWVAVPHPVNPGKFNKFPTDWRTGAVIDAHDPQYWTSAANALSAAPAQDRGHGSGAGFVFTADDPYFFHDIDGALEGGQWSRLATELCGRFNGAAIEVSHSGQGLHIFGQCNKADPRIAGHASRNTPLHLELYTSGRFVALTGTGAMGNVDADCTEALAALVTQYFTPTPTGEWAGWTSEPVAEWSGPEDDDELIRRMTISGQRNPDVVFGGKLSFVQLWEGDDDAIRKVWPTGRSEADQALANHLAFWTGKNCDRMEALMRRSALARDKWDTHRTYLADTIIKACAFVTRVAAKPTRDPPPTPAPVTGEVMAAAAHTTGRTLRDPGQEYMTANVQLEYFQGCFYVAEFNKIYSFRHNEIMNKAVFDVRFGGHLFTIDPINQKMTDSAWDAFTMSRVNFPLIVNELCFRPEIPGGVVVHEGIRCFANSYVPHVPRSEPGDVSKFTGHLAKLLPDDHDRALLLNYMASLVQNPGRKFQWWPVVQGVKGNGKTLLLSALTHIVGEQYTHLPNTIAMAREGVKFNSWIYRKLLIGMEEVRVNGKWDFLEELKAIVTNMRLGMEAKGVDVVTRDNRANGLILTNHRDGIPVTDDERRYAVFFTAQQTKADLTAAGMDGAYFPDLWDWFFGRKAYAGRTPGAAHIAHYLLTFPIDAALDPADALQRAPDTTSTREAIDVSLGRVEQEIREMAERGAPGFAGGWVSSKAVDDLIDRLRANVPRMKRRALLQTLGYDWHPGLPGGRTHNVVMPDACKVVLYVKPGHLSLNLTTPPVIANAYTAAQAPEPMVGPPTTKGAPVVARAP